MVDGKAVQSMSKKRKQIPVADFFKGKIGLHPSNRTCGRCGAYHMSEVKIESGKLEQTCHICVGCGYFTFKLNGILTEEGVAFLVECQHCHKCQTWIKYPLKIFRLDKDVRDILYWTCDCCKSKQKVRTSMLDPTKSSTNAYAQFLSAAKVVRSKPGG